MHYYAAIFISLCIDSRLHGNDKEASMVSVYLFMSFLHDFCYTKACFLSSHVRFLSFHSHALFLSFPPSCHSHESGNPVFPYILDSRFHGNDRETSNNMEDYRSFKSAFLSLPQCTILFPLMPKSRHFSLSHGF